MTERARWTKDHAYYRCRYPREYALACSVDQPANVYLPERQARRRTAAVGADSQLRTVAPKYTDHYTTVVGREQWEVYVVNEVRDWLDTLDPTAYGRVVQAIDTLADTGPGLGRPLVDTIHGSTIANLKELRPGSVRILFVFDPWRSSILLVAGDKAGRWKSWYTEAIPLAEHRYERYLKERAQEEEQP